MSDIIDMAKAIKNLLIEAELKEVIGELKQGDVMQVVLDNGESHTFRILSTLAGNFIIKSDESGNEYYFGVDDFTDGMLSVNQKGKNGDVGSSFKVKTLKMGSKGGHIYDIEDNAEPNDDSENGGEDNDTEGNDEIVADVEGLVEDVEGFNKIIENSEKDDVLKIELDVEEKGEMIPYEITFKVVEVHDTKMVSTFIDSKGDGQNSQYFIDNLNGRQMVFDRFNSFEVRDESVRLSISGISSDNSYKLLRLPNIISVDISKSGSEMDIDNNYVGNDNEALSDAELINLMKDNNDIVDYFFRQEPNFLKYVNNASPKGRWQIAQMIKSAKLDNAYLSKNSKVEIEIVDRSINSVSDATRRSMAPEDRKKTRYNKKLKRGNTYDGRVIDDNKITVDGQRDKRHWVITLKDEIKKNIYNVKYEACLKNDCVGRGTGVIKITDIKNK